MKLADVQNNPYVAVLYDKVSLTINFPKSDRQRVQEIAEKIRNTSEFEIEIKKPRRRLDANAKMWVLISKIAKELGITPLEVYRQEIQDMGCYDIIPVRNDVVDRFVQNWESRGIGWICDSLGASKIRNYTNLKCHYGSSVFDTKEMSAFIDKIIMDCQSLGIETDSPEEIERLKKLWDSSN